MNNKSDLDATLLRALYGELSGAERERFDERLGANPDERREYEALQAALELASVAPKPPRDDEDFWADFMRKTLRRFDDTLGERRRFAPRFIFAHSLWAGALQVAALVAVGFWLGRFWQQSFGNAAEPDSTRLTAQASALPSAPTDAELKEFLQQSHLLLLGVMNLNGECGARDPNTLATQQQHSVALLVRAGSLKTRLPAGQNATAELIGEIEYALMQLADIKPAHLDARSIERIRSCSGAALCNLGETLRQTASQ